MSEELKQDEKPQILESKKFPEEFDWWFKEMKKDEK